MRTGVMAAWMVLAGSVWGQGAWGQEAPRGVSKLERFYRIRTPGAPTMMPDGTLLTRDWPEGIWQVYRAKGSEARAGGAMEALTSFADGASGFTVSPDYSRALVFASSGGNENTQIYELDLKGGGVKPLVSDASVQHSVNGWIGGSDGFLYTANRESPNDFYIYRYDFSTGVSTKLLGREGSWAAADITGDGGRVIVGQYRSASDSSLYELDTRTGATRDLTLAAGKPGEGSTVAVEGVGYLPGEGSVLLICDVEDGRPRLFQHDLASGATTKPLSDLDAFEIDGAEINHERTLLSVVTNEEGFGVVHVYRLPGFERVELPAIAQGVASTTSLRGDRVQWTLSNARTPGINYAYEVPAAGKPAGAARQVTFADTQGLDLASFPLPRLVKYKAFDGVEIPAFLWLPPGHQEGTAVPFVVNYHGGPEGQHRPGFNAFIQYVLSEGFGVLQPNVRGSTGYGREFHMLDNYKNRWNSVRDGVDAAEWLVAQGYARAGKIATYGGSYGGFMSVACLVEDQMRVDAGKRPSRLFGSGINVVGIVNMKTFLEKTAGYRRKLREVEYGPLSDPEFLVGVSSMTHIDKLNVPMFIAHGFNDPRVPVEEAMQVATALKDKALATRDMSLMPQLFIAPDEGHGFAKLDNRLYFGQRASDFLRETIGK